jgi:hypothetical protein
MAREKVVIAKEGEYTESFREHETARAIKSILKSDSFIVITKSGGSNEGVSCVADQDIPFMAFNCKKMETNLIEAGIEVLKQKGQDNDDNSEAEKEGN